MNADDRFVRRWVTLLALPALAAGWTAGALTRHPPVPDLTVGATLTAPTQTQTPGPPLAIPPAVTVTRTVRAPVQAPTVEHPPPPVATTPPAAPTTTPQPTGTTAPPTSATSTTAPTTTTTAPPLIGLRTR